VLHAQQGVLSHVSIPHVQQANAESVGEFGRWTYHGHCFDVRTKRIFLFHSDLPVLSVIVTRLHGSFPCLSNRFIPIPNPGQENFRFKVGKARPATSCAARTKLHVTGIQEIGTVSIPLR
jgi:hypothetical protein